MNLLTLLNCVAFEVSPGRMYGQLLMSWRIYCKIIRLVREHGWYCFGGVGADGVFLSEASCVFDPTSDMFLRVNTERSVRVG